MRFFITVKPNAKKESVVKADGTHFVIAVKAPPIEGRANEAVCRSLAEYLGIPKSRVRLLKGQTGKHKVFDVL